MNSEKWDEFLKEKQKVLIFDTETSGLGYTKYDILSLSWQVIDLHLWSKLSDNSSLKFEIMAKQLYVASQRVL